MSIELEQLRKVARQTDIDYLRDDGTVETISLSSIVARLEALEKVAVAARRYRHSEKIAEQAMANCSAVIVFPPDLAVILDDALAAIPKP